MEENIELNNPQPIRHGYKRLIGLFILIIALLVIVYAFILRAPSRTEDIIIHITYGESIKDISDELYQARVVKSPRFLHSLVAFFGSDQNLSIGDYKFERGVWLPTVAYRLSRGVHNIQPVKVTIPEGKNNDEIADIFANKINNFNKDLFLQMINGKQGYLFPDTYFFYPMTSIGEIVTTLENTFTKKTKNILNSGYKNYSKEELVIMASLVEEEANGKNDASAISGILWNRLSKGMPLQVDVAPMTYKVKGLPNEPITNFGLVALDATVKPMESNYLYYLHDKDGMIHTALTYTEHKRNIAKYLK